MPVFVHPCVCLSIRLTVYLCFYVSAKILLVLLLACVSICLLAVLSVVSFVSPGLACLCFCFCLSLCLPAYSFVWLCLCDGLCVLIRLSVCLSVYLPVSWQPACRSAAYLSNSLSVSLAICLSVCPPVYWDLVLGWIWASLLSRFMSRNFFPFYHTVAEKTRVLKALEVWKHNKNARRFSGLSACLSKPSMAVFLMLFCGVFQSESNRV